MNRKNLLKNFLNLCIVVICVFTFSGCESLEYTDEQEDIIANYAANLVLRHDVNYKYNYITEEESTQEETNTVVEKETTLAGENSSESTTQNTEQTDVISTSNDITSILKLPTGITAEYMDYDVVSQYPGDKSDDVFIMKALDGNKLLVVKFKISNTSTQDISLNMMQNIQKFKGIVNGTKKYNAQLTLLLDALNTYEGTLSAGSVNTFVLVYQTQLDSKDDVTSLSIAVTDASNNEIQLNLK